MVYIKAVIKNSAKIRVAHEILFEEAI